MFSLKRTVCLSLVGTSILWSCQASSSRIRRRATVSDQSFSSASTATRTEIQNQELENDVSRDETHRHLSGNATTCAAISVSGFPSCAAFCESKTGYTLNTFIELDHGASGKQYCCACFSGDAYCSDDIPECVDYVNLDFSGLSIKWNNSEGNEVEAETLAQTEPPTGLVDIGMNVSCMDANVTDSLSCVDFCEEKTGDSTSEYRGNAARERYFCVCSNTLIGGGNATYCQDNMSDRWKDALSNSTILPLSTRLGVLP
jgi:hypothetical protein